MAGHTAPQPSLSRLRLWIFRAAWVVFVILSLAAFGVSFYTRYSQLGGVSMRLRFALQGLRLTERFLTGYLSLADIIMMSGCVIIALVLVLRKFNDWMAVFLSMILFVYGVTITRPLESFVVLPAREIWLLFTVRAAATCFFLLLCYLFPDGRFVPRWTRYLAVGWVGLCLAWLVFPEVPLNLVYFDPLRPGAALTMLTFLAWMGTGLYAQVYRYLRVSGRVQQQQTKLVVFGIAAAILGLVAFLTPASLVPALTTPGPEQLVYVMAGVPALYLATLLVPISIAVSILRYRLWDIDLIIRRTLAYSLLTAVLAVLYILGVILLQAAFGMMTGSAQSGTVTVITTLAIAALFNPLRNRIQGIIDRRFYRRRYDIERTLADFASSLRDEVDLDQLSDRLVEVVQGTMQPEHVSLWMLEPPPDDIIKL